MTKCQAFRDSHIPSAVLDNPAFQTFVSEVGVQVQEAQAIHRAWGLHLLSPLAPTLKKELYPLHHVWCWERWV